MLMTFRLNASFFLTLSFSNVMLSMSSAVSALLLLSSLGLTSHIYPTPGCHHVIGVVIIVVVFLSCHEPLAGFKPKAFFHICGGA
jgi:hypothetical protein